MQTDATSQNIVGPNNIGIRWELLALVDTFKLKQLRYFGLNNSPFCPKLFLYLFIGPLTFFPQINSLYLTRLRGKSFPREGKSAVPPRDLTIFWCIYSRFSVFCLNVSCFLKLFAQLSLISYVYYNPERRKRVTIVCCLKKILQCACADVFTRPTLLGFHAHGATL